MKHPCHEKQVPNLKRVAGQIEGIKSMIENGKYCVDILNQIKAARSALMSIEQKILEKHIRECVKESLEERGNMDEKIEELMSVLKKN